MIRFLTEHQAEEIVLMQRLTGKPLVECVYAVLPGFDQADIVATMNVQIKITAARETLDKEFKETHSQPTPKGD
jgi:hypothetical protein